MSKYEIHSLVPCPKPTEPLTRNTIRRTRQGDGKLVHQYFGKKSLTVYNTDGRNWWRVVTAVRGQDGHVYVFG